VGQYSGKEVPGLEATIDRHVVELISVTRSRLLSSESAFRPVDFSPTVSYFTLDVITDIAFGVPFGYLSKYEDVYDFLKTSHDSVRVFQYIATFPILPKLLGSSIFRRFTIPSIKDKVGLGRYMW
jgi:hypothetical protein